MSVFAKLKRTFSGVRKDVIVVSGLPRSGTSMMMKMLEVGGVPPLSDGMRKADTDNPKGYYEFERVKMLPKGDYAWIPQARGKTVKVISALLPYLPEGFSYRVLFMRRNLSEVIASQGEMLTRRKERGSLLNDDVLAEKYVKHLQDTDKLMKSRDDMICLDVSYNSIIVEPTQILVDIDHFLGGTLDREKMMRVVDPSLHRQKA